MDNLQAIWQQLNATSAQLEVVVKAQSKDTVYDQLLREQRLRKRYNPLLICLILMLPFVFAMLVPLAAAVGQKILGISLITASAVAVAVFSQIVKMPLKEFEYNRSATAFLQVVKRQLDKSRQLFVFGLVLQIILLTGGVLLLILPDYDDGHFLTYLATISGIMFGLGGLSVGGGVAFFNRHYKNIYDTISAFGTAD